MEKIDQSLQEISAAALEKGFELLGNGKRGLTPFAMTENETGEVAMHQFSSESIDEAIHLARQFVRQHADSIGRYAIATLGFVSTSGRRREALLVEAGEIGGDVVITLAQAFKRKGVIRKRVKRIGQVAIFGRSETPLGSEDLDEDDGEEE